MFGTATPCTHVMLARAGRVEEVRPLLARSPMPAEDDTYWSTVNDWVFEAEAAVLAEDRGSGDARPGAAGAVRRAHVGLGRGPHVSGPVDGYLALAGGVRRRPGRGLRSADAALATAAEWGFTAYVAWLRAWRDAWASEPSAKTPEPPGSLSDRGNRAIVRAGWLLRRLTRWASSPLRAPPE